MDLKLAFSRKNCRCELYSDRATARRACARVSDHVDSAALAKACPGAACAYVGRVARIRRRRCATDHCRRRRTTAVVIRFCNQGELINQRQPVTL